MRLPLNKELQVSWMVNLYIVAAGSAFAALEVCLDGKQQRAPSFFDCSLEVHTWKHELKDLSVHDSFVLS